MLCDFSEKQKAGQGERLKFSFEGLDVLMAFGRPAPVVFLMGCFVVANMGIKKQIAKLFRNFSICYQKPNSYNSGCFTKYAN
jgi:hypothetical protein